MIESFETEEDSSVGKVIFEEVIRSFLGGHFFPVDFLCPHMLYLCESLKF